MSGVATGRTSKFSKPRAGAASSRLLARIVEAGEGGLAVPDDARTGDLLARGLIDRTAGNRWAATAKGRAAAMRAVPGETGFLAQHVALGRRSVTVDGTVSEVVVDLDESPLAWLARRKGRDGRPLLAPHEVQAGERLRADFTRGQMTPRVTANWEAAISRGRRAGAGAGAELAEAAMAARSRVARALDAVGPELSGALLDVCCFLKGLEEVEKARGWPARGAKLVLGLALARLARHYGYGEGPARPEGRIVRWGTADSRPRIDGGPSEGS
jgi:hypothetical protein